MSCHSITHATLYSTQVDLVSGWHDNLKSKKDSAAALQGDKGKGGKRRGKKAILEDSDSDTDT